MAQTLTPFELDSAVTDRFLALMADQSPWVLPTFAETLRKKPLSSTTLKADCERMIALTRLVVDDHNIEVTPFVSLKSRITQAKDVLHQHIVGFFERE